MRPYNAIAKGNRQPALAKVARRAVMLIVVFAITLPMVAATVYASPVSQRSSTSDDKDADDRTISALDVELSLAVAERLEKSGDYERALERYAEALELAQTLGDSGQLVFILRGMGSLQRDVEEYADSNSTLIELLMLQEDLDDEVGSIETMSLIGANLADLGQTNEALELLSRALDQALTLEDTQLATALLSTMAGVHQQENAYQDAVAALSQAREIAESVNDLAGVIDILEKTGSLQHDMGAYTQATETLNELLGLQEELGDSRGAIKTLSLLSTSFTHLGLRDEAEAALDQAVELSLDSDDPKRAFSVLRTATKLYEKEQSYDDALAAHLRSLEIATTISDTERIGNSLADIGSVQREMALYEDSNETFEELLVLQDDLSDSADAAKTLSLIGANYIDLGQGDEATRALTESAERARDDGNIKLALGALYDLADFYADEEAYDEAIQVYDEALRIAMEEGTPDQVTGALKQLSQLQRKAEQYAGSNETLSKLLALQEETEDLPGQVGTLALLGANHADLGETRTATTMFDRSTEVALSIDDVEQAVDAYQAKAGLYHDLAQYSQEVEQYAAAVSVASKAGEWMLAAESAETMGRRLNKELGRTDEAIESYQQAADFHRRAENREAETVALMVAAELLIDQQRVDEALAVYDQAIQTAITARQIDLEVQAYLEKGDRLRRQNRTDEALAIFEVALGRAQTSNDQMLTADALQYIAKLHAGRRHYEEALEAYQQVLDIVAVRPDDELETKTRRSMWTMLVRTDQLDAANNIALGASGITIPTEGEVVSGSVRISGLAQHPEFRKWQLDLLVGGDEGTSSFLALGERPLWGTLLAWDSTTVPDGKHTLRLRVVRTGGNYDEYYTPIIVQN